FCTAAHAPLSIISLPLGRAVKPSQRFQAGTDVPCGRNSVPTGSAAKISSMMPGLAPLAMMTDSPAAVARPAPPTLLPPSALPSRAEAPGPPAGHVHDRAVDERHGVDFLRDRAHAGIAFIEAIHDREQDEQRRLEQVRHHGGKVIVVAELDLSHAHGVVLV